MDNNLTHLVERFFDNELNAEERKNFIRQLSEDPALAAAFEKEKELIEGIEAYGNRQLRQQLQTIHTEEIRNQEGRVVRLGRRKWWWAAAVLLLGLVARWIFSDQHLSPQQLYAMHARHDINLTEMGTNEDLLARAQSFLDHKDYHQALPLLEQYLTKHPDQYKVHFAKGIALMETGRHAEARSVFRQVGQARPILQPRANWYTALSWLHEGDVQQCKKALSTIPPSSGFYKKAEKLKKYLK
ncbi:MAG TPA: tetratricopeptide repeat protein [Bacteroidetes bacterium]|nr:tetratricopeptide repeat protein [Bacteroidota bacterium]